MANKKTPDRMFRLEVGTRGPGRGQEQVDGEYAFRIAGTLVPSSSASTGLPGQIASDNTYIYLCDSDGSWRQSTFTFDVGW